MTAELEDQEKHSDGNADEKSPETEKIQIEESPKNGAGNDLKTADEEENAPAESEQVDEAAVVAPRKRAPRFWEKLFRRAGQSKEASQDTEAGTELLSKDGKVEIQESKQEKNGSGTDITVAITDDNEITGDAGDAPGGKTQDGATSGKAYWKRAAIGISFIILVLVIVSVISIMTAMKGPDRGPMIAPLAITDCGSVQGYIEDKVYIFRGIPYALPPTGERRWKPPVQPSDLATDCWTDTYEAINGSTYCFQEPIPGFDIEMSEDCLYLDIITPSLSPPELRPVVVYIPGDQPMEGYNAADLKWRPTTALADEKDVTFVTINYRLGVFGFLTLELLTNSITPNTSGNYGIMDMLAALRWVQRNIRSFGGDPEKVTVLANGGAATAGLALLSSKKVDRLFKQMWLTGPSAHFSNKSLEEIGKDNAIFLRKLGCDSLECLHNKTAEEVLQATPSFWETDWSYDLPSIEEEQPPVMAVIDGQILYDTPYNMWNNGDINDVAVVIGSTAQESGSSAIFPNLNTMSWSDFSEYVKEKLDTIDTNLTEAALQSYIKINSSSPVFQFHTMVSDIRTICPLENLTESLGRALQEPVYWYVADYVPSSSIQVSNSSASVQMAVHGVDVISIFGLLDQYITPFKDDDKMFQKNVQELFFNFVHHGTPKIGSETLMSSEFFNTVSTEVLSKMTPYKNCQIWRNAGLYPMYAKMN